MTGKSDTIRSEEKVMGKDKYQQRNDQWKKENLKFYAFRLSKNSEQDMIDFLDKRKPVYTYIKGLIRSDMEKQK